MRLLPLFLLKLLVDKNGIHLLIKYELTLYTTNKYLKSWNPKSLSLYVEINDKKNEN